MNRDELMKRMNFVTDSIQNAKTEVNEAEQAQLDEISNAVEKLKEEYDRLEGGGTVLDSEVEQPVAVDKPVVMDEYVEPVEEINQ
jgi:cell division protein FtsB